jgi:hypothetical protein
MNVRNNEQLKAPNAVEYITPEESDWRTTELIKCAEDPIYFAENYFYIVAPVKGSTLSNYLINRKI